MFASLSFVLTACANDPLATCAPVEPNTYNCTSLDGGFGEFVSLSVVTTDAEAGFFPRAPGCVFEADGGEARLSFDAPFCRSPVWPTTRFERIEVVNVPCVIPENGAWRFAEPGGRSVFIERTDAGHRCSRTP